MPKPGAFDVVTFWREAGAERWFSKDPAFDQAFREQFLDLHMAVAARERESWLAGAEGILALILLTDQFPRNAFRGTAHMYATDPLARYYARQALSMPACEEFAGNLAIFLRLPFAHSENLADQDLSVALHGSLSPRSLAFAERHRDIIRRFGRFPHRNAMLARETTAEEAAFLAEGGFAG